LASDPQSSGNMVASFWGAVVQKRISLQVVMFLLKFDCWFAKSNHSS